MLSVSGQRLLVPQPRLWDEFTPYLYTVRTTLTVGEEVVDTYEDTFGIRYMQLDPNKSLRINGKAVKLRGGCIHHDNGVLGTATFYDSEERRVRIMKEMGYNAIRMSHHPMSKAMLRACDKLGGYVMDEFSDVWSSAKSDFDYGIHFDQEYPGDVAQWVLKDYNHPCVILYSIGNEIPETGNKYDTAFSRKIIEIIRPIDDTRYVMNSIRIEAYSDAPEVELFVNGKSVGRKTVGEDRPYMAVFETVYEPGEVKAAAIKDNKTTEFTLHSAGEDVDLAVTAKKDTVDAFTGVGYVDICLADSKGIVDFSKNAVVTVSVEDGELVGLGSADPRSNENYTGSTCATYQGSALAVVRAWKPGEITVKVSSEGCGTKIVTISAV